MDLKVHRAILYLALQRVRQRIPSNKSIVDPSVILDRMFYPLWLGNWLTDMNQASAFFDVLESKYRDPYTRWRSTGAYEFPEAIQKYGAEWVNMFNALWQEEQQAISRFDAFRGIALPHDLVLSDPNQIGGYYPFDHFDVADRQRPLCPACKAPMAMTEDQKQWACANAGHARLLAGNEGGATWEPVPDVVEYDEAEGQLSQTICRGVFAECLWGPLHVALVGDRSRPENLRALGKALHVLHDLFAHSNFVEILLLCADRKHLLPKALSDAFALECVGPFAAYVRDGSPSEATVITGRFDQVDTAASILKIYRENLVTRWDDLDAGGYRGEKGRTRDLMIEVLFGTFSNQPFVPEALKVVKQVERVRDFFSQVGDWVTRGAITFFGWLAKKLCDKEAEQHIDRVQGLLLAANDVQARDYSNAGRIMYVERVISKTLEDQLKSDRGKHGAKVLPHHTLLAKDHDVSQPECRLAFKLATLLAVDLTALVLERYLTGGGLAEIEAVLRERIVHPARLLEDPETSNALAKVVPTVYGQRWWQVGKSSTDIILC